MQHFEFEAARFTEFLGIKRMAQNSGIHIAYKHGNFSDTERFSGDKSPHADGILLLWETPSEASDVQRIVRQLKANRDRGVVLEAKANLRKFAGR